MILESLGILDQLGYSDIPWIFSCTWMIFWIFGPLRANRIEPNRAKPLGNGGCWSRPWSTFHEACSDCSAKESLQQRILFDNGQTWQTWQTHTETIKANTCRSVTVLGSRKQWGKAVSFTTSSSYEAKQDDLLRMRITPKTPKEECWRVVTWLFFIVFLCFCPWCSKMFAVITCAHVRRCHSQEHRKDAERCRSSFVIQCACPNYAVHVQALLTGGKLRWHRSCVHLVWQDRKICTGLRVCVCVFCS